jgi:hypothetical protein
MPKLAKDQAKSVAENEGGFPLADEGVYFATLLDVKVSDGPGASGYDYWIWEYGDLVNEDTGQAIAGHQFNRTSLSPAAEWKVKESFDAFGVPPTTDTDELIGRNCRLAISQAPIEGGARDGQMGNNVDAVLPESDDVEPAPAKKAAAPAARKARK